MAERFVLFFVLLLSQLVFLVSGQVFWSLNCGASDFYLDDDTIYWMPDATLTSNGVARVVEPSKSISKVLNTLRVFTNRRNRNCYSIPVTKGQKVLIRASFNYGNYDGYLTPPIFDLHFDGNFWTTVETSISGVKVYEVIYVTKRDTISVCVSQINKNSIYYPFISALEVRSVDFRAYNEVDENQALFLVSRFSYGAIKTLRFPQDPYDRIWLPTTLAGTSEITSDAISIDPTGPNNPPAEVLKHAVESVTDSLVLGTVSPSNPPLYVAAYFSEVTNLNSTLTRSFRFYESTSAYGNRSISLPISPPYRAMIEQRFSSYTVGSLQNITLIATDDSDLPPLINAIEVFNISKALTSGTYSNDVEALAVLQTTFNVLGEWSGDPCLPVPYSWDWISCNNETRPRVTSLNISGFGLSGSFPDISGMDALEIIDLHNNSLTGVIPSYLGSMTDLRQLNLADNDFRGTIPTSLLKNNKLNWNVTGNPLCTSVKSCSSNKKKKSSKLPLVLGITIPAFFLISVAVGVFIFLHKKKKPVSANLPVATEYTTGGENGNANQ